MLVRRAATVRHTLVENVATLVNASTIIGAWTVTSALGIVYWWLAARHNPPSVVGIASAMVSAMNVLAAFAIVGLGTWLIGELPVRKQRPWSLISAALLTSGGVGLLVGVLFAWGVTPLIAEFSFFTLRTRILFAIGVSAMAISQVLDQGMIGLLRGGVQFTRNVIFAVAKLLLLIFISYVLIQPSGTQIYGTWVAGIIFSLGVILVPAIGWRAADFFRPAWRDLRLKTAFQHHFLNLIMMIPSTLLPVLVTVLLSPTDNGWFFISFTIAGFLFMTSFALTTVLYAVNAADPAAFAQRARLTLSVGLLIVIAGNLLLQFYPQGFLSIFGPSYAAHGQASLKILALAGFPEVIRSHFIAVTRLRKRMVSVGAFLTLGTALELALAIVGGIYGQLEGLCIGWLGAVLIEALFMTPGVARAIRVPGTSRAVAQQASEGLLTIEQLAAYSGPRTFDPFGVSAIGISEAITMKRSEIAQRRHSVPPPASPSAEAQPVAVPVRFYAGYADERRYTPTGISEADTVRMLPFNPDETAIPPTPADPGDAITPPPSGGANREGAIDVSEASTAKVPAKDDDIPPSTGARPPARFSPAAEKKDASDRGGQQNRMQVAEPQGPQDLLLTVTFVVLPIAALMVWWLSLGATRLDQMNDLGLVSVYPPVAIVALAVMIVSFCVALATRRHSAILLLHLVFTVFMLYGVTTLVEPYLHFATVYRHAGYVEFITRTGTLNPNLDAYFNWPGFFLVLAFLVKTVPVPNLFFTLADWSPVVYNLLYLGASAVIFSALTKDRRLIWLGLWIVALSDWIGQDYLSPQGLAFFLYLMVIAILLTWFKTVPNFTKRFASAEKQGKPRTRLQSALAWLSSPEEVSATPTSSMQRIALIVITLLIMAFVIFSHPLTPFILIAAVGLLLLFGRIRNWWLLAFLLAGTGFWYIVVAQPYLAGHLADVLGGVGQVQSNLGGSLISRLISGNSQHDLVAALRVVMTALLWGLAFFGAIGRIRAGYRDINAILLALAPFPFIVVQSYGGEILLRVFFFALPFMAFFAAALFYRNAQAGRGWRTAMLVTVTSLILLGGFMITRYGNERVDYKTAGELAGVAKLYAIAPKGSLLIGGWSSVPWQYQDFEDYYCQTIDSLFPDVYKTQDTQKLIDYIDQNPSFSSKGAFLIFTRSTIVAAQEDGGYTAAQVMQYETNLQATDLFTLVYSGTDAQILQYVGGIQS
jgi:hypothetical protein